MYYHISNRSDYEDKLTQAEYAFDRGDYRTAFGYFNACLVYARENGMRTDYLEMKIEDCRKNF